jgi:hypothetical protein
VNQLLIAINIFEVRQNLTMIKKMLLILSLALTANVIKAQKLTQFSSDSIKFYKELNDYFMDFSANKKDAEEYMLGFQKVWKSPEFPSKYRQALIKQAMPCYNVN